jgi:hypothetical protein
MTNIKVGNITNSVGVLIGGGVAGSVHIAGGDITINGKRITTPKIAPCFYCHQPVPIETTCPHCGGPYHKQDVDQPPGDGGESEE